MSEYGTFALYLGTSISALIGFISVVFIFWVCRDMTYVPSIET